METGKKTRFAALAVITAAYAPLLWLHFRRLWANDEYRLTFWVQGIASHAGSSLLDFFAVNHLLSGSVLRIPGREFLVQDTCGGIPSFISLVALAAILAVFLRRPHIHAVLLLVAGGFWAAIVSAFRLTCVVLLHTPYAVEHFMVAGFARIRAFP